jgi:hypothetical protein
MATTSENNTPHGVQLHPRVAAAMTRLKAAIASKPPALQAEQDRRFAALQRCTSASGRRPDDSATPYRAALLTATANVKRLHGTQWDHCEALANVAATHLCAAYDRECGEPQVESVRNCIRRFGPKATHRAALELLRERSSNIVEVLGVLTFRAEAWAKRLRDNGQGEQAGGGGRKATPGAAPSA